MLHDTNPKINKQPCFLLQNWGGGGGVKILEKHFLLGRVNKIGLITGIRITKIYVLRKPHQEF